MLFRSVEGNKAVISGEGAWKELSISSETTGEILISKKFYKADFGDVMKDEK